MFGKGCASGSEWGGFRVMSRQICVEVERNSDFLGNITGKIGIDGGGVVEDTSKSAIEIPILHFESLANDRFPTIIFAQ